MQSWENGEQSIWRPAGILFEALNDDTFHLEYLKLKTFLYCCDSLTDWPLDLVTITFYESGFDAIFGGYYLASLTAEG